MIDLGDQVRYYQPVVNGCPILGYYKNDDYYAFRMWGRPQEFHFEILSAPVAFITAVDIDDNSFDVSAIFRNKDTFFLDWKVPFWEPSMEGFPRSAWISSSRVNLTTVFHKIRDAILKP